MEGTELEKPAQIVNGMVTSFEVGKGYGFVAEGGGRELFVPPDFEGQHFLEDVPVIAQGPNQVAQVATALQTRLVCVLQGHGAYARGQTLWDALHWITALEESAHIAWLRR